MTHRAGRQPSEPGRSPSVCNTERAEVRSLPAMGESVAVAVVSLSSPGELGRSVSWIASADSSGRDDVEVEAVLVCVHLSGTSGEPGP